jgi:signal transduction histidine kinase
MGGGITVKSALEVGTTFEIRIPVKTSEGQDNQTVAEPDTCN